MSFREKSAWAMGAVMLGAGLWYLAHAGSGSPGIFIPFTVIVIVASILAQVAIAVFAPREAQRPADERERIALHKAGHWAGIALAAGAVGGAIRFLWFPDAVQMFHAVIGALILSQVAEYALQIWFFRRGY